MSAGSRQGARRQATEHRAGDRQGWRAQTPAKTLRFLTESWLRVFRSVNAVHLPHGGGQAWETTAVSSEKGVARCDSAYDAMGLIAVCVPRALPRGTGALCMPLLLIWQEVRLVSKPCHQFHGHRKSVHGGAGMLTPCARELVHRYAPHSLACIV